MVQLRIPRFPHFAHAAFANGRDYLVSTEFLSGLQFHERPRGFIQYTGTGRVVV
jgi:hypothetical protein